MPCAVERSRVGNDSCVQTLRMASKANAPPIAARICQSSKVDTRDPEHRGDQRRQDVAGGADVEDRHPPLGVDDPHEQDGEQEADTGHDQADPGGELDGRAGGVDPQVGAELAAGVRGQVDQRVEDQQAMNGMT